MNKLKYTTFEISNKVKEKISQYKDLEDASKQLDVPIKILDLFFQDLHFFDLNIYLSASKILNISLSELTKVEEINMDNIKTDIKYRENINKNTKIDSNTINQDLDLSINIFSLIIDNYKLSGDII